MKLKSLALAAAMVLAAGSVQAQEDVFTGDKKLACEAVLCLAAPGSRPSECEPSIRRYFRIDASSAHKLKKKRRNFLKQCPDVDNDLVNSLVSGQCNSKYQDCQSQGGGGADLPRDGHDKTETL